MKNFVLCALLMMGLLSPVAKAEFAPSYPVVDCTFTLTNGVFIRDNLTVPASPVSTANIVWYQLFPNPAGKYFVAKDPVSGALGTKVFAVSCQRIGMLPPGTAAYTTQCTTEYVYNSPYGGPTWMPGGRVSGGASSFSMTVPEAAYNVMVQGTCKARN